MRQNETGFAVRQADIKMDFVRLKSPICRTVQTFLLTLGNLLDVKSAVTDEFCRERFGHNTCDARSQAESTQSEGARL